MTEPRRAEPFRQAQREIVFLGPVPGGVKPAHLGEQLAPRCHEGADIRQAAHQIDI